MSRLSDHRQRIFMRKLIFLVIALVALTVFMITIGFKFLINSSLFVNRMSTSEETEQTDAKDDFFGTVDIENIPTATNSARFVLSGSVTNYNAVEMYINDKKVKEIRLANSDSFSEEIGSLKKGENEVYVRAKATKEKQVKKSDVYTVIYSNEKPKLEIKEPGDNSKVFKQELKVSGTIDKDNEVTVNGSPVVIDQNGNFETTILLREGDNTITIEVEDLAGNTEKKELKVTYQRE